MKKLTLLLLLLLPLGAMAQEKYTDQLKRKNSSGATVVVHQDADIEEMVNGNVSANAAKTGASAHDTILTTVDDAANRVKTSGPHVKINGFRVQIYMAGNTAKDKNTVREWARRFKNYFPDVNAYVYFNSPHWICSVGDFRSREEAAELLTQVRGSGQFNSSSIVRSKINYFY